MKLKNSTEVTKDFHMKPLSSERSKSAPEDDNHEDNSPTEKDRRVAISTLFLPTMVIHERDRNRAKSHRILLAKERGLRNQIRQSFRHWIFARGSIS